MYVANVIVNGNPDVKFIDPKKDFRVPVIPDYEKYSPYPDGSRQKILKLGPDGLVKWIKDQKSILYTDTTFRDAHQSLLATRVRTKNMLDVAESFAKNHPQVFSMEMWGGATFDVALRFLHECPWQRLQLLREAIPNILFQMLIRGSNAIGYKAYPDNLIERFIEESAKNGIDIFRIFDSLNWVEGMKVSIKAVRERTGGIAEAAICYTGEILNPDNKKYTLQYYLDLARQLEDEGAHILAIKDMAGLLKPYSAEVLVRELKKVVDIPIHLHTHDTSSLQPATYLKAVEAGVDIIDVAIGSMSGLTSQPNFNSIVAMLQGHERELKFNLPALNQYSNYWEDVREFYYPFESDLKAGTAQVFENEIPGGQYSNLRPQAESLGLGKKFEKIKHNYAAVNKMFGDIVKVTPSSKVVGDMALFMTSNSLSAKDVMEKGHLLSFPESVKSFFKGELGQPHGGFPKELQKMVLKDEKPFTDRPNDHLDPIDFDKEFKDFQEKFGYHYTFLDFLSYQMYPKVFEAYYYHNEQFGDVTNIPTPAFFYGLKNNEEILIKIASGKTIIVKMLYCSSPDEKAMRTVYFELNGQTRRVQVKDNSIQAEKPVFRKAEKNNEIGAPLQGKLGSILVKIGDKVKENTALFVIEAMKMETTITSNYEGKVKAIYIHEGNMVEQDDMVLELE
jgi:pyruvate carboxylase